MTGDFFRLETFWWTFFGWKDFSRDLFKGFFFGQERNGFWWITFYDVKLLAY